SCEGNHSRPKLTTGSVLTITECFFNFSNLGVSNCYTVRRIPPESADDPRMLGDLRATKGLNGRFRDSSFPPSCNIQRTSHDGRRRHHAGAMLDSRSSLARVAAR